MSTKTEAPRLPVHQLEEILKLPQGMSYGATDDIGYFITEGKTEFRDRHATILHLLGMDHEKFTYSLQGLDARLSGVEPARIVRDILA